MMRPLIEKLSRIQDGMVFAEDVFGRDLEDLRWRADDGMVVLYDPALGTVTRDEHPALGWVAKMASSGTASAYRADFLARDARGKYLEKEPWEGSEHYRKQFIAARSFGTTPLVH